MNKRIFLSVGVLVAGMILAGCTLGGSSATPKTVQTELNVTLAGTLSEGAGGIFLLKTADKGIVQLHNAGAKLESFVGKSISVTGQYSGTTLYVDKVTLK